MVTTMADPDLTVEEVAERLKVSKETVRRWLRDRKLRGWRISDKAGWRVSETDLQRFRDAAANRPADETEA
jgi:excisionase family DNA binding protein